MNKKHFNIPLFIPDLACPFRCIYCHQPKITGTSTIPGESEIRQIIEGRLNTIPTESSEVEIAFFGGNFTGLDFPEQERLLRNVQPWIESGKAAGIRLSTRPDCISEVNIDLLKKYNVICIELGAQSMDDEVLKRSARGHTSMDTVKAAGIIRDAGIRLGLQMMIGLPGDSQEKAVKTCKSLIRLKPDCVRIYPVLIIRGTILERLFNEGKYSALSLDEAISWTKPVLAEFEHAGITILKVGLHPTDDLVSGKELIAGPFHPSFRELVYTELWKDLLLPIMHENNGSLCRIFAAPGQINYVSGFASVNRKALEYSYKKVQFSSDLNLRKKEFYVHIG